MNWRHQQNTFILDLDNKMRLIVQTMPDNSSQVSLWDRRHNLLADSILEKSADDESPPLLFASALENVLSYKSGQSAAYASLCESAKRSWAKEACQILRQMAA